jgi:acetyltransferase EpsM
MVMNKEVIIIGADDAIELAQLILVPKDYVIRGYLNHEENKHGYSSQFDYLGTDDLISEGVFSNACFILALSSGTRRKELYSIVVSTGNSVISLFHPSATIYPSAEIMEGTLVLPQATIATMARIGKCVNISYGVLVGHDVFVGDYAFISPGVQLLGGAKIGSCVTIGANAVVFPNIEIGSNCTIAANSVVTQDVPSGSTVIPQHTKNRILGGNTD